MALALDVRYSQYRFRTELQIILDNITVTILIYSLTIAAFIMIIIWKYWDMAQVCPLSSHWISYKGLGSGWVN